MKMWGTTTCRRQLIAMIAPITLIALIALVPTGTAEAQSPPPPDRPPIPTSGVHPRLRIVNQCTTPVWAIFTPGGQANQVLVQQKSGAWFRAYAQQERFAGTGATADPSAKPTSKVTIAAPPGNPAIYFVPGQFIEIVTTRNIQASTPGPTAKITAVSHQPVGKGTVLTLDRTLTVPSDPLNKGSGYKAQIFADQLIDALQIPPPDGKTARNVKTFAIPDAGAPSGRFSFFSGCAKGDTDPFNQHSCAIGAADTDLAAINTVAEVSFGCNYSSNANQPADKSKCTFNPGAVAPQFPKCQANPNGANCGPLSTSDYYDVSAVDGYTFPLRVDVGAQSAALRCNSSGGDHPLPAAAASIDGSMLDLASCPTEGGATLYSTQAKQQKLIDGRISLLTRWNNRDQPDPNGAAKACVAPYKWFESATLGLPVDTAPTAPNCAFGTCSSVSYYAAASCDGVNATTLKYFCPADSGPQQRVGPHFAVKSGIYKIPDGRFSIHNTNFVRQLYAMGYTGYTWQFDDGVGLLNCPSTAAINNPAKYTVYTITACPNGGTRNPAQPTRWTFSAGTGSCVASPGAAASKSYGSLLACQQANMRYVCDDVTGYDPYHVPDALWRVDPQATLHKSGFSWSQVATIEQKTAPTCRMVNYPNGVSPDFPRAVQLPLCTYYYGGSGRLCPATARFGQDRWHTAAQRDAWRYDGR